MKTRIIALACIIGISNFLCHDVIAQQEEVSFNEAPESPKIYTPLYLSLMGQLAIPQGPLKAYSNSRGGVRVEVGKSFAKHQSFGAGVELGAIFSGGKKDNFKGLEVTTKTTFTEIHPFLRWTPKKNIAIKPFLDISSGITIAYTATTSTVVDEATFLEEVLLGNEDEVETTTQMDKTSANFSYSIGAGVIIKKYVMIGVRYQHTNPLSYTDKNEVFIKDNKIQYNEKHIPLDMVVITIGVTMWGNH